MPRKRVLETASKGTEVTGELKELAVTFYQENLLANEHGTKAKNARKTLFGEMLSAGIKSFVATMKAGRGTVDLNVEIGPGRNTSEVDMARIRKIVNDDQRLLELCTMTKTDVVKHFGTAIADQVCKTVPGTENVQVKTAK